MGGEITEVLRSRVARRAGRCCEYCLIHEDDTGFYHQVDHIISRKHGGLSGRENLAYACVLCNRKKGSDVASLGRAGEIVRLFHPRTDQWVHHFRLDDNRITALSDVGAATLELLGFNAPERLAERTLLRILGRYPATR